MTSRLPRASVPALGALALCAAFGVVGGVGPVDAIAGVLALAFVCVVFADLTSGLACFTALSFLDTLQTGRTASFDKLAGLLLLVAWLLGRATTSRATARQVFDEHRWLIAWIVIYEVWSAMSAAWAQSGSGALEQVYRYALDMLLIPIVFAAVRTRRDLTKIIAAYLIGASFSVVWGLTHPSASGSAAGGRLVGSLGEANQSATVLVAALALIAGSWLLFDSSPRLRGLAVITIALSFAGLVTTLSRAGLIAFGVVLLGAVVVGGRWRRPAARAAIMLAIVVPVYFFALAPSHARHRVTSDQSSGRNDIWTVAWRAFSAHPAIGVGAGNFEVVSYRYLQAPGQIVSADDFLTDPKVVHNIYLEQLATLGVPGLIMLLGIIISVIALGLRAAHIFERLGDRELELMSRFWILALVAFLAADFFASELVSKQLWLILSLGPALLKLAHGRMNGEPV